MNTPISNPTRRISVRTLRLSRKPRPVAMNAATALFNRSPLEWLKEYKASQEAKKAA